MREALTHHWPEYLMEAGGLGIFMLSACVFAILLEHPASPVRQAIGDPLLRRLPMRPRAIYGVQAPGRSSALSCTITTPNAAFSGVVTRKNP
jgi:hypothetical protein